MATIAGFMAVISAGLLFTHFFPGLAGQMGIVFEVIYPITALLMFTILAFGITNLQNKAAQKEYKSEVDRLRRELDITKKRVSAGKTTIQYPPGYIESERKKEAS